MKPPADLDSGTASSWRSDEREWLPRLPTRVILGDVPMNEYLRQTIKGLDPEPGEEPEPIDPDFPNLAQGVPLGDLRPLFWRDWRTHLQADQHERLANELDADLWATTSLLVGRARQIAWYLSAKLLGEDVWTDFGVESDDDEDKTAFQSRLVRLLSDLTGFGIEATAGWEGPNESSWLFVHLPERVVVFWHGRNGWSYGWHDPKSGDKSEWRLVGRLPGDTTVGGLASFIRQKPSLITEGSAQVTWPFRGDPPDERPYFLGRR